MEAILYFADLPGRNALDAAVSPAVAGLRDATGLDEERFQSIYAATARPIHGYLVAVTGSRDIADDVLQETYFRFLTRRTAGLPLEEARPYLFRIASNLLRDRWRARREEQWPENFDQAHFDQQHTSDLNTQLDIHRILQALKPKERLLLWLAYVEGMSHAEIAAATGLTALSIRPLLFRARKKAAALLQPEGKRP
jgi:RNA polymerase sigma-70 factor (ECF subfamily)